MSEATPKSTTNAHWSDMEEAGAYWGLRFLATIYRIAGRKICMFVMFPILFFFFLVLSDQRAAIHEFLSLVAKSTQTKPPGFWTGLRNFIAFGGAALDKIAAWNGDIKPADVKIGGGINNLFDLDPDHKGALLFVSHLGNVEVIRAVAGLNLPRPINVLVHTKHAQQFNKIMQRFNPQSQLRLIEVTEVNPTIALDLRSKIEQGEWVVIAADRPPVNDRQNVVQVPFLGKPASFAIGPYVMAHILERPVYMVACLQRAGGYDIEWQQLAERIKLPRHGREANAALWAEKYANWLSDVAVRNPHQWYNFFNFWASPKDWNNEK